MKLVAFIEEEKRWIKVWKLQVAKDCFFVEEIGNDKVYTVKLISLTCAL